MAILGDSQITLRIKGDPMGKEKIFTIPVLDAFKEDSECPFCNMLEMLEKLKLEFVMGNSYMEDDIRIETNRLGFCQKHLAAMDVGNNRLGLALMLQTHMHFLQKSMDQLLVDYSTKNAKKLFSNKQNDSHTLTDFADQQQESCYICEKINHTFSIYTDTFFYLWKSDLDFQTTVKNCKGFCISHFSLLIEQGKKKLSSKEYLDFLDVMIPLQKVNFDRVLGDIDWFVTKFDYRYSNEPWKNSQDAIPRAIKKISSLKL